jgi:WD40 repeat protein
VAPGDDEDADGNERGALPVRDRGRYAVIAEHGRGGIGRVLRATDRELGRDVAVKELLVRSPSSEARFAREAMITARLEHPNIVPVHEAGRWDDGTPFYAMKLVAGRPLKALIEEAKTYPARLALLGHVLAVADAIAYAHDRGVLHRDLKPSNIIVGDYGETIVIDWGLAKASGDRDDGDEGGPPSPTPDLTVAGAVLGTPAYMAPEQASGAEATTRSDVYALGAILLDVLRGGAAPAVDTASAYASGGTSTHVSGAAESLHAADVPELPPDLRSIVRRAMATAPVDRYPTARAFGDDVRRFLAGTTVAAHRYSARERAGRWMSAHRRVLAGGVLALVALLAASIVFLLREQGLRAAEAAARRAAEAERDRADTQTLALLEQQGRTELAAGRPSRALPLLVEAYRRAPVNQTVRWLVTDALRAVDARELTFSVTPPPEPDGKQRDYKTYTVALTPDDAELVTGQKISIGIWDAATGALRRRFAQPTDGHLVRTRSDGRALLVMAARKGGTTPARILDIDTGAELAAIPVGDRVEWFAWAPDGSSVAVIASDGTTDVWATTPPRKRFSFPASPAPTYGSITFSDDGHRLAARAPGEIILAEVATGALRRLPLPGSDAKYLTFSPDGSLLAATMADRAVRFWDVASGQPRGQLRQHAKLPEFAVWSPDGTALVTTTGDTHHLWDVASTEPLASLDEAPSNNAVFARGRAQLFSATSDGLVSRWNLARATWARQLPGHRGWTRAAYTADGAHIVTVDEGDGAGHLRMWTAAEGRLVSDVPLAWNAACGVAVSLDGRRVAAVGSDGGLLLVDTATGALLRRIDAGPDPLSDLALSPDGALLAAAAPTATVRTWRIADGAPTGVVIEAPKRGAFSSVAFSPDGRRLLTSIAGWDTQVWDAATGAAVFTVRDSLGLESAYSADGRRIVSGGSGTKYPPLVADAATGAELLALPAIQETTPAAAISRDGSLAAIMSYNGVITIASATTGAVLRVLDGPTEVRQGGGRMPSTTLAFSPDDRHLLATGHGFVLLWNIELDPRTPDQAAAVAAAKSPWRLVDGRLVREPAK